MRTLLFIYFLTLSSGLFAENLVDITQPVQFTDGSLVAKSPAVFRDKNNPKLFYLIPKSFQVKEEGGSKQQRVLKLSDGRRLISFRLVPNPSRFEELDEYRFLMEEILKREPHAVFTYPNFANGTISLMGPVANWVSRTTITGGIQGGEIVVSMMVDAIHGDKVEKNFTVTLALLGSIEFKLQAWNGFQTIDWPVSFAWHISGS